MAKKRNENEPAADLAPEPVPAGDPAPEPTTEPVAADPAPNGGLAEIAKALVSSMPEPQPEAIAAVRHETSPEAPQGDPAPAPEPKKGRGRPKGSKNSTIKIPNRAAADNVASAPQPDPAAKQLAATRMAAGTATQLTILTGVMLGGEDFKPGKNPMVGDIPDDEFLRDAYFEYFQAKGMIDLPPGVALASALMVYVMPRLNKPNTQTRVGFLWVKTKGLFGRFFGKKNSNGAYANSRDDRKRQNDDGSATVESVQNGGHFGARTGPYAEPAMGGGFYNG